jgi:Fe-S-cluster containining protein
MHKTSPETPWYGDGLAFECTRCGACCTGAPGFVWVSVEEMQRIAEHRGEDLQAFASRFVRQVGTRYSLIERPNGDCIFWDRERGCTVYESRPIQCQTWPFWSENVETPGDWEFVKQGCPGAGRGRVYTAEEILQSSQRTST